MTSDELRDAARMFWRLDQRRAERPQHLVAALRTAPLEAYEIVTDSLTYTRSAGERRAAFELVEVQDSLLRSRQLERAVLLTVGQPRSVWHLTSPTFFGTLAFP
jgi:hypothetical protein